MSAASDRVNAALASLDEKAKIVISTRGQAAAAQSDFSSQVQEVDAAIEALKTEKAGIIATLIDSATAVTPAPSA